MKKELENYFQSLDDYCKDLLDKTSKSNADDSSKIDYVVDELSRYEDRKEQAKERVLEKLQITEESFSKEQNNNETEKESLEVEIEEEELSFEEEEWQAYLYQERLERRHSALERAEKEGKTIS